MGAELEQADGRAGREEGGRGVTEPNLHERSHCAKEACCRVIRSSCGSGRGRLAEQDTLSVSVPLSASLMKVSSAIDSSNLQLRVAEGALKRVCLASWG